MYVSLPVELAQYTQLPLCIVVAKSAGVENNGAPVSHVAVQAVFCAAVDCSTFQATVVLAFAVTVPVSTASHTLLLKL